MHSVGSAVLGQQVAGSAVFGVQGVQSTGSAVLGALGVQC